VVKFETDEIKGSYFLNMRIKNAYTYGNISTGKFLKNLTLQYIRQALGEDKAEHVCVIFYVLLTVHLSVILDNDQLDTQLLYFTVRLL
jgi:hypothetical protein